MSWICVGEDGLIRQYGEGTPSKIDDTDTVLDIPEDEVAAFRAALGGGENRLDENGAVVNTPPPPPPDPGPTLAERLADLEAEVETLKERMP